jgi:hypothetical protein
LTPLEKEVFELIKRTGEIMTTSVPSRIRGVIPSLVNKDLIEVVKRRTSQWKSKKKKFLRVKEA